MSLHHKYSNCTKQTPLYSPPSIQLNCHPLAPVLTVLTYSAILFILQLTHTGQSLAVFIRCKISSTAQLASISNNVPILMEFCLCHGGGDYVCVREFQCACVCVCGGGGAVQCWGCCLTGFVSSNPIQAKK